jgi:hypothetical protein
MADHSGPLASLATTSPLKLLHKLLHNAFPQQPKMHRNRSMTPYISQQHLQG